MRAVCVLNKSVTDFILEDMNKLLDIDLIVFGYGIVEGIDFSDEIKGSGGVIYDLALLSGNLKCALLAGCDTYLYGVKRKSCLVYNKGKLLGIADSNYVEKNEGYMPGFGYKIFETDKGSFGVAVDDDIKYPLAGQIISHALGDFIFHVSMKEIDSDIKNYAKATSMLGGLDGLYVFLDDAFFCSSGGDIDFGSGDDIKLIDVNKTIRYNDIIQKCRR